MGRFGPVRVDGEVGYHFGNHAVSQSWSRGLLVGHEFSDRTEASKQRETTLGLGGRQSLNRNKTLNLLLMGGRSFQAVSAANNQPSLIAYVGLQVLLGPRQPVLPHVDRKLPDESKP